MKNLLLDERDVVANEYLLIQRGIDIEMCIILLRLDVARRVTELGILSGDILMQELFSGEDIENWTSLETAWANILRNTAKEVERRLDEREKLLLKKTSDITERDERRYEILEEEILQEIQEAIQTIEKTTQSAIEPLLEKTKLK
ncbi:hypothetical protein LAT59_02310 [Candidatus Gracilibacteria bacterium]|nr:hypothetical protein [Candidatus Gracilibacteria bacterium]